MRIKTFSKPGRFYKAKAPQLASLMVTQECWNGLFCWTFGLRLESGIIGSPEVYKCLEPQ